MMGHPELDEVKVDTNTEVTKGKKGKFRYQKRQGMISFGDDTEISIPNYF